MDTKIEAATRFENLHRTKEGTNYGDLLREKWESWRSNMWTKRRQQLLHVHHGDTWCARVVVENVNCLKSPLTLKSKSIGAGGGGEMACGRSRDTKSGRSNFQFTDKRERKEGRKHNLERDKQPENREGDQKKEGEEDGDKSHTSSSRGTHEGGEENLKEETIFLSREV